MCLSIPGKIIKIESDVATIDYGSEKRKARIIDGDYEVGDYVLVSAKIVSEKIPVEQVSEWLKMLQGDEIAGESS